ncbi:DUF1801 domain-containing protein [Reichenbachiella sp. MALMAid0571]|uniref:DUF1801 domain-containing protein n=1 Tax=Reichenbachiella sp. MALMAid0571 TaxID=3143939 RepID=UPI0032DEBAA6
MQSKATTIQQYLNELPEDRKPQIEKVREVILNHLPEGYEEVMNWGMICYEVPLAICPDTYNKKPLMYAALASQKNHMAVYLSGVYASEELKKQFMEDYLASGKKPDMGKSCIRFRKIENLPLEVIGNAIASFQLSEFVEMYQKERNTKGQC